MLTVIVLALLIPFFPVCGLALLAAGSIYLVLLAAVAVKGFVRTRRPAVFLFILLLLVSLHAARLFGYIIGRRRPD